jgi:hypothetical protein
LSLAIIGCFTVSCIDTEQWDTNRHRADSTAYMLCVIDDARAFALHHEGRFPDTIEELSKSPYWKRSALPLDPWGRSYVYEVLNSETYHVRIYSLGRDGKQGGKGFDEDTILLVGDDQIDRTSRL